MKDLKNVSKEANNETDNTLLTEFETDDYNEPEVTHCYAVKTDTESEDETEETNKREKMSLDSEKSNATVSICSISETEMTRTESRDEPNQTDKSDHVTTWQQFLKSCSTFVEEFLDFFKCARTYQLTHVNINGGVISRSQSEKRIIYLLAFLGLFMTVYICIMIAILISLIQSPEKYTLRNFEQDLDGLPVLQKLVVIYDDGNAFFMVMNKTFELEIVDTHNFNYDKCGFYAYDQIDHIQTLVGRPGQNNFMHDSKLNGKNISG